jgi:hypothetical protein
MAPAEKSEACPLCGGPNGCSVAAGEDPALCWCMRVEFPAELTRRIPEAGRDQACVCAACAGAAASRAESPRGEPNTNTADALAASRPLRTVVR